MQFPVFVVCVCVCVVFLPCGIFKEKKCMKLKSVKSLSSNETNSK